MEWLLFLLYVLLGLEILMLFRVFYASKNLMMPRMDVSTQNATSRKLYFLLPALREQSSVKSTLSAYLALCGAQQDVTVVVITTEKEIAEQQFHHFSESTADMVQAFKQANDTNDLILHLNYPGTDGNKSDQLNYAIDWLLENDAAAEDFVAIYDFDAKPSANTVSEFKQLSSAYHLDAIQQVPLPVKGIEESLGSRRLFVVVDGMLHIIRSFGTEKFRLLVNNIIPGLRLMPYYLCGSGMYVKLDSFSKYGKLPFVDDVPYGYRLYIHDAHVGVMQSFNQVDIHKKLTASVNSNIFVFHGVIQFFSEIARTGVNGLKPKLFLRNLCLLVFGLFEIFEFILYPIALIVALFVGLALSDNTLTLLAISISLFPVINLLASINLVKGQVLTKFSVANICIMILIAPLRKFWRALGPLIYVYRKFKSMLVSKPVIYNKTER